ncbi:MAG: hypothetical protein HC925_03380, partial [Coleofasciculaceae cyanobacterium SM2_3_26]|nr:hypothetical protein [Coleofasciculaceae cyanobacterium SM2_3_26]
MLALPLQETRFDTVVVGTVAESEVVQVFHNPFEEPIEAIYLFPLHEQAAVDDYAMTIGDRTIRGKIDTRERARETYEEARAAGKTAGLLEQERPNIFTQSLANIPPGFRVETVPPLPRLWAPRTALYRVLLNLIDNAVKFAPPRRQRRGRAYRRVDPRDPTCGGQRDRHPGRGAGEDLSPVYQVDDSLARPTPAPARPR